MSSWTQVRGRGKASRVAGQPKSSHRGVFSRLESGNRQRDHRGAADEDGRRTDHGGRGETNHDGSTYGGGRGSRSRGGRGTWSRGGRGGTNRDNSAYRGGRGPSSRGGRGTGGRWGGGPQPGLYNPAGGRGSNESSSVCVPQGDQTSMMAILMSLQATVIAMGKKIGFDLPAQGPTRPQDSNKPRDVGTAAAGKQGGKKKTDSGPKIGPEINSEPNQDQEEDKNFTEVCKSAFRYVQVSYHTNNWKSLPQGVEKALSRVIGNIKPPMLKTSDLSNELAALGVEFGQKVCQAVQNHLKQSKIRAEQELLKLDDADAAKAKSVVEKRLIDKFGKKISDAHRTSLLTEAIGMVGLEKATISTNRPVTNPLPVDPQGPSVVVEPVTKPYSLVVSGLDTPRTKKRRLEFSNLGRMEASSEEEVMMLDDVSKSPELPIVSQSQRPCPR